jgi:hypothetical protein
VCESATRRKWSERAGIKKRKIMNANMTNLSEKYCEEFPAFRRKKQCADCGEVFYKKLPFQTICQDCSGKDLIKDEQEEISWEEAHGAYQDDNGEWIV